MTYTLQCEMKVPLGLRETFAIFENAANLERITPPWLNFRILTPSLEMRPGLEIDYVIRWLGIPMNWKTLITDYEPPKYFIDFQVKGPYSLWRHLHTFRETESGTLVADRVDYQLPLGPLGVIAHGALVGSQLKSIFRYRQSALAGMMGGVISLREPEITAGAAAS